MGLGGVGVKLADLVTLYAGLARLGTTLPLDGAHGSAAERPAAPRRLLDPAAAWHVGNILLGTPPPENAAGGRIAFKTGTSYGYRDAWAVGFDGRRTIGVWVGRPDGAPVPGSGRPRRRRADPVRCVRAHRQAAGGAGGARPRRAASRQPASCRRRCNASDRAPWPASGGEPQLRIMFPPNGARLELASDDAGKLDPIALKVTGGSGPLTVLVNGVPQPVGTRRAQPVVRARRPRLRAAHRDG